MKKNIDHSFVLTFEDGWLGLPHDTHPSIIVLLLSILSFFSPLYVYIYIYIFFFFKYKKDLNPG